MLRCVNELPAPELLPRPACSHRWRLSFLSSRHPEVDRHGLTAHHLGFQQCNTSQREEAVA